MRTFLILTFLIILVQFSGGVAAQNDLTTTDFQNRLTVCAAGYSLKIEADMLGSIADIYEGDQINGTANIQNEGAFLKQIPIEHKLKAYELYLKCIENIVSSNNSTEDYTEACVRGENERCEEILPHLKLISSYCGSYTNEFSEYERQLESLQRLLNELYEYSPRYPQDTYPQHLEDTYSRKTQEAQAAYEKIGKKYQACLDTDTVIQEVRALLAELKEACEVAQSQRNSECNSLKQDLVSFLGIVRRISQDSGYSS